MTANIDFLALYQELHLRAGCSTGELKRAYRRRVAELHPDRRRADQSDPLAAQRLQELNAAYGAAMSFQRRHGRLPGAMPATPASATTSTDRSAWQLGEPPLAGPATVRPYRLLVTLVIVAALAWALWGTDERGDNDLEIITDMRALAAPEAEVGILANPMRGDRGPLIGLGTDASRVREVEGAPSQSNRGRWHYGPSWFEFEHDKVRNWYSSPSRPLHVAEPRPNAAGILPRTP